MTTECNQYAGSAPKPAINTSKFTERFSLAIDNATVENYLREANMTAQSRIQETGMKDSGLRDPATFSTRALESPFKQFSSCFVHILRKPLRRFDKPYRQRDTESKDGSRKPVAKSKIKSDIQITQSHPSRLGGTQLIQTSTPEARSDSFFERAQRCDLSYHPGGAADAYFQPTMKQHIAQKQHPASFNTQTLGIPFDKQGLCPNPVFPLSKLNTYEVNNPKGTLIPKSVEFPIKTTIKEKNLPPLKAPLSYTTRDSSSTLPHPSTQLPKSTRWLSNVQLPHDQTASPPPPYHFATSPKDFSWNFMHQDARNGLFQVPFAPTAPTVSAPPAPLNQYQNPYQNQQEQNQKQENNKKDEGNISPIDQSLFREFDGTHKAAYHQYINTHRDEEDEDYVSIPHDPNNNNTNIFISTPPRLPPMSLHPVHTTSSSIPLVRRGAVRRPPRRRLYVVNED